MSEYEPRNFRIESVDITIVWLIATVLLVVLWLL